MSGLPRGWSHAQDEFGIRHEACGIVAPHPGDPTLREVLDAMGRHLRECKADEPARDAARSGV